MPIPVFVLGSPRNGTTWLSNIIGNHPDVSAIRHEAHWGAHESNIYTNWSYWDDLQHTDDFIAFAEIYASTDYFRLSAVEDPYFSDEHPSDFLEFYLNLMDEHARRNGTRYWTTKLDPLFYAHPRPLRTFLRVVTSRYDDVRFVAVKRSFEAVARSYVHMQGRKQQNRDHRGVREAALLLATARYESHYSVIDSLVSPREGLFLRFNDLSNHRVDAAAQIRDHLDLRDTGALLEDAFPSNSSFRGRSRPTPLPQWALRTCHDFLRPIFSAVPSLAHALVRLRDRLRFDRGPILYWRLLKLDRMPERLKEELHTTGNVGLLDVLFPRNSE